MDKISPDDVINISELPLYNYMECPIDSMISLYPVMCKKCETLFCPDCIDNWKQKSNICPMRCNPIEIVSIDKSILKHHIGKMKLACTFHMNGCLFQVPVFDVSRHEKICDYREINCDKCLQSVPNIGMNNHLYESCEKNKINCFVCTQPFTLKNLFNHLKDCKVDTALCKICIDYYNPNDNHNSICPLRIDNCAECQLPDLYCEITSGNHKCMNRNNSKDSNLNSYLKSVHSKYEIFIGLLIKRKDINYSEFTKRLSELGNEIMKKENDKLSFSERKFNEVSVEKMNRLMNIKKDKLETLNKMKNDISEWNNFLENKNKECFNLEEVCEKNIYLLKREYELKIEAKAKHLNYLRNLMTNSGINSDGGDISMNVDEDINANMNIIPQCRYCQVEVADSRSNKCGFCSSYICKSCSKQCKNEKFEHPNNNYCKDCFTECLLCSDNKQCKSCIKKCFFKGCQNNLCNRCYDKNTHQLRSDTTNCRFYKCENCQTDSNCIMTTVNCPKCEKRVCRNCYLNEHKSHMILNK